VSPPSRVAAVSSPEPDQAITLFGTPLFGLAGPGVSQGRFTGVGYERTRSGRLVAVTNINLDFTLDASGAHVGLTTLLTPQPIWFHVRELLGGDLPHSSRPRFPQTSTVTRDRAWLPVDGRRRPFAVYACGEDAIAVANVTERTLKVTCQRTALPDLHFARLDHAALDEIGQRATQHRRAGSA
jgi:hypothetical protein